MGIIYLKNAAHIELIRKAGTITADCLGFLSLQVKPGITGLQVDKLADEYIRSYGGVPASKNYLGYPHNICVSINSQAVHCFPTDKPFQPGDVVKLDLMVSYQGFVADSAVTILIPPVKPEVQALSDTTYRALFKGIEQAVAGKRVIDISKAIYEARGSYGVIAQFCGHGVGRSPHEEPRISNIPRNGDTTLLVPGMTVAIEPIFSLGFPDIYYKEGTWPTWTLDNSPVTHHEHTILITEGKPEILTLRKEEVQK